MWQVGNSVAWRQEFRVWGSKDAKNHPASQFKYAFDSFICVLRSKARDSCMQCHHTAPKRQNMPDRYFVVDVRCLSRQRPSTLFPTWRRRPAHGWRRPLVHEITQAKVLPRWLLVPLRGTLDAKRSMLVRYHIVFIFRVDRLMLGRDVYFVVGEAIAAEVLEEVGVAGAVHVHLGESRVFVLRRAVRSC